MNTEYYKCFITGKIMFDPVNTVDGQAFEKEAMEEWLRKSQTHPITNARLESTNLIPNQALKNMINDYLKVNKSHFDNDEVFLSPKMLKEIKANIVDKDQNKLKSKMNSLNDYRYFIADLKEQYPGYSAFYLAAETGSLDATREIFEYLFKNGLMERIGNIPQNWKPNNLIGLIKHYLNVSYADLEKSKIQILLKFNDNIRNIDKLYLENIFMDLSEFDVVKWLFETKMVSLESRDRNGNTLLLRAVINHDLKLFAFLLVNGADLNAINSNNENCYFICLQNNYTDIFKIIVDDLVFKNKINIDISGIKDNLLHLSIILFPNNPELIKKIINSNKSLIDQVDSNERTPLFVACQMNDIEAIKVLIENGSNVNHVDKCDKNCLHLAVEKHNQEFENQRLREELLSILIKKNINVFQIDSSDKSPLDLADRNTKNFLYQKINEKDKNREDEIENLRVNLRSLMDDVKILSSKIDELKK